MAKVFSLQGCMAVGKTTAAQYIQKNMPQVYVSFEENAAVIKEIAVRQLDKNIFADYVEIQKLFIANETERFKKAQLHPYTLMDFGAEEIEFYTLHYPIAVKKYWPVQQALQTELKALQACMPDKILFLEADAEVLKNRKEADTLRSRTFFSYYITHLMPLKKVWFAQKTNVDFLNVSRLTPCQVGCRVQQWIEANS
ncbi:MAG: hypothetical protein PHG02_01385 [Oscillospiraceae bacterium]|nr:hypothetical protein [Oscillospiraceae bacterium]